MKIPIRIFYKGGNTSRVPGGYRPTQEEIDHGATPWSPPATPKTPAPKTPAAPAPKTPAAPAPKAPAAAKPTTPAVPAPKTPAAAKPAVRIPTAEELDHGATLPPGVKRPKAVPGESGYNYINRFPGEYSGESGYNEPILSSTATKPAAPNTPNTPEKDKSLGGSSTSTENVLTPDRTQVGYASGRIERFRDGQLVKAFKSKTRPGGQKPISQSGATGIFGRKTNTLVNAVLDDPKKRKEFLK